MQSSILNNRRRFFFRSLTVSNLPSYSPETLLKRFAFNIELIAHAM